MRRMNKIIDFYLIPIPAIPPLLSRNQRADPNALRKIIAGGKRGGHERDPQKPRK
jgi:hypothetical protein